MEHADQDKNSRMDQWEYTKFVNALADGKFGDAYWRFDLLPRDLQNTYFELACPCDGSTTTITTTNVRETCCPQQQEVPTIDIHGLHPGSPRLTRIQINFLTEICIRTRDAIRQVPPPPIHEDPMLLQARDDQEKPNILADEDTTTIPDPSVLPADDTLTESPLLSTESTNDNDIASSSVQGDVFDTVETTDKQEEEEQDDGTLLSSVELNLEKTQPIPTLAPTPSFFQCLILLRIADGDQNGALNRTEYMTYVNQIGRQTWRNEDSFFALPLELQNLYTDSAPEGGMGIDIGAATDSSNASDEELDTLRSLCRASVNTVNSILYPYVSASPAKAADDEEELSTMTLDSSPLPPLQSRDPSSLPLSECFASLQSNDIDGDLILDENEYLAFVNQLSGQQFNDTLSFDELWVGLRERYDDFNPGGEGININGTQTGRTATRQQRDFLGRMCNQVNNAVARASNPTPTLQPSYIPSISPSFIPSITPSHVPSIVPSQSVLPSVSPSTWPSSLPTVMPSSIPSSFPSSIPSLSIVPSVSDAPTISNPPTLTPTTSQFPSRLPSRNPTTVPSQLPSSDPTTIPSQLPSDAPSLLPTSPTMSLAPSSSSMPSVLPTLSLLPSLIPSSSLTPSVSLPPSILPTTGSTNTNSTSSPANRNATNNTSTGTSNASRGTGPGTTSLPPVTPTPSLPRAPSSTTISPTPPSSSTTIPNTFVPVSSLPPSQAPSEMPSNSPSMTPSTLPSSSPSTTPTNIPSIMPSNLPSIQPSSQMPSFVPSITPSRLPSTFPSQSPSISPSALPSSSPSQLPEQQIYTGTSFFEFSNAARLDQDHLVSGRRRRSLNEAYSNVVRGVIRRRQFQTGGGGGGGPLGGIGPLSGGGGGMPDGGMMGGMPGGGLLGGILGGRTTSGDSSPPKGPRGGTRKLRRDRRRRRLVFNYEGGTIDLIQDTECPSDVPLGTLCQNATAHFDVNILQEPNPGELIALFEQRIREAIDRGALQFELDRVDENTPITIEHGMERNRQTPAAAGVLNTGISRGGVVGIIFALLIVMAVGYFLYRRYCRCLRRPRKNRGTLRESAISNRSVQEARRKRKRRWYYCFCC